jgi:hypothetical protein
MFMRDPRAAALFENTYAGTVRSYWAALVILPLYVAGVGLTAFLPEGTNGTFTVFAQKSGYLGATVAHFCIYTLCWFVAWPLVFDRLAAYLDCDENFFRYIAAYNWMHVLYAVAGILFVTGKMSGIVHDGNSLGASLALYAVLWSYHWFIMRHALGLNGIFSAIFVAVEFAFFVMVKDFIVTVAL